MKTFRFSSSMNGEIARKNEQLAGQNDALMEEYAHLANALARDSHLRTIRRMAMGMLESLDPEGRTGFRACSALAEVVACLEP